MLHPTKRLILFYDIFLKSFPEGAPPIPLKEAIERLIPRWRKKESVKLINNETASIRLKDLGIDEDSDIAYFLINYSDTNIVDPVFENLETGKLRTEAKLKGEGISVSTHLVVSLVNSTKSDRHYLAVLEDVPGIGKTKLEPFLTSEFKEVSDFSFEDEANRERDCRPIIEFQGHLSQKLKDDIKDGALREIELIKYRTDDEEFDEDGCLEEKSRKVLIKVQGSFVGRAALAILNKVRKKAAEAGYNDFRVRFKKGTRERDVKVDSLVNREDIGDVIYVCQEVLDLTKSLPQSSDRVQKELLKKMIDLIESKRDNDR